MDTKTGGSGTSQPPERVSVDSMGRRTWNREYYLQLAQQQGQQAQGGDARRAAACEVRGSVGARAGVDFTGAEGRRTVVDGGHDYGFVCRACGVSFSDSVSFIKHANTARHQRNMGFAGLPGRATAADVRARLALLSGRAPAPEDQEKRSSRSRSRSRSRSPGDKDHHRDRKHHHRHRHHHRHHHRSRSREKSESPAPAAAEETTVATTDTKASEERTSD